MKNKNQINIENKIKNIELQITNTEAELNDFLIFRNKEYAKSSKQYNLLELKLEKQYDKYANNIKKLQIKLEILYTKLNPTINTKYTPEEIENAKKILNSIGYKIGKAAKRIR